MAKGRLYIEDRGTKSDPETVAIIKAERARHQERKPVPPPPTPEQIAYRAAFQAWRAEDENLRGKIFAGLRKRYAVYEPGALFTHMVGEADTLAEAKAILKRNSK